MKLQIEAVVDVEKGSKELAESKIIGALEGITASGGEGEEDYSFVVLPDSVKIVGEFADNEALPVTGAGEDQAAKPEGSEVAASASSDVKLDGGTGQPTGQPAGSAEAARSE